MPAKIARLATRPPFWIPEVSVAVRSSRLPCSKAEKTQIFMADRQSSGDSRPESNDRVTNSADRKAAAERDIGRGERADCPVCIAACRLAADIV